MIKEIEANKSLPLFKEVDAGRSFLPFFEEICLTTNKNTKTQFYYIRSKMAILDFKSIVQYNGMCASFNHNNNYEKVFITLGGLVEDKKIQVKKFNEQLEIVELQKNDIIAGYIHEFKLDNDCLIILNPYFTEKERI